MAQASINKCKEHCRFVNNLKPDESFISGDLAFEYVDCPGNHSINYTRLREEHLAHSNKRAVFWNEMEKNAKRLEYLNSKIKENEDDVKAFDANIQRLQKEVTQIKIDIATISNEISELKNSVLDYV